MTKNYGWFFLLNFFFCVALCDSQNSIDSTLRNSAKDLVEGILKSHPELFSKILSNVNEFDVQIIYTQIDRDKHNDPSFTQFDYGLDPKKYFYAASLVKLPCAALALEKINELKVRKLNKYSCMQTDSAWKCQKVVRRDTSSETGYPSVAHYIKKMMLVSDNNAYSRIYEFLGQEYINTRLSEKGYPNMRVVHRFDGSCFGEDNSYTNPISFYDMSHHLIYKQPMQHNLIKYSSPIGAIKKGVGYVDSKEAYVYQPKDFTYYNYICLQDINDILRSIIFPDAVPERQQFNLKNTDYTFLYKYMSMYPCESKYPKYGGKEYKDSYKKYFIYGTCTNKIAEDTLRIFNVVGQSYGYLSDCAYICDFKNKVEFLLSAVIYANSDGILNDGKYDYDTVGFPFLENLGKSIYEYELKRKKNFAPNLSDFKLDY